MMDHPESARSALHSLLAERSVRRGTFTLASGRVSSFYVDARLTTMSPEGLSLIGPLGLYEIRSAGWTVDCVGGLTLGADPIAYAISYAAALDQPVSGAVALRAFTVRKEAKAHGTGKLIEGPFRAGDRACVIEDTITTGGSALRAVEAVRAAGGVVVGVLALVDREEGGRGAIEAAGVPVRALARISELLPLAPSA
ncbi:MAG: orotate phosphoribosyltransferase [Gemmatimonadaceae bacterium]|jgi:orotate phosphoribosyltransferase|nr:orotate phosphoribosyltransferase [Gemmatimonadaceae bacterium]